MGHSTNTLMGVGMFKGRTRLLTVAGALPLAVVVLAPIVASTTGLMEAGQDALGLAGVRALLVPLVFDAAAAYAAVLAMRSVLAGESALVDRVLVWTYATGSAALNVWHADTTRGLPAALFYGAASVSAVLLWDRTLRAVRRSALQACGRVQKPAPHFRFARWVIRPGETARAWAYGVTEGVSSPAEALAGIRDHAEDRAELVDEDRKAIEAPKPRRTRRTTTQRSNYSIEGVSVASKKEALELAFRTLGSDEVEPALAWLADRGVTYSSSSAYRARNELLDERARVHTVTSTDETETEAAA